MFSHQSLSSERGDKSDPDCLVGTPLEESRSVLTCVNSVVDRVFLVATLSSRVGLLLTGDCHGVVCAVVSVVEVREDGEVDKDMVDRF